ncbi:protein-tyrosine phosphatase family protein [Tundrisphaera sp. TA3]|uniref:protein-tyrosine phosphatase family protein n=1 Tax=Tundrisphaera sp. TA3 TaxID=3435775 RepID=UPI003EB85A73
MTKRRIWTRRVLFLALGVLACHQAWRHGHDYLFADRFAEVEPGRIYRGAWQKTWPMKRIIRDRHIKTIVALAHPMTHPLPQQEQALAKELGVRWVHVPIVDQRGPDDRRTISDLLEIAASELANPANQPVYFHCHHGINRASMVQMAYRMLYCNWTLEQASAEIDHNFGLVEVSRGPDYRHMEDFYRERVLPRRMVERASQAGAVAEPASATARTDSTTTLRK